MKLGLRFFFKTVHLLVLDIMGLLYHFTQLRLDLMSLSLDRFLELIRVLKYAFFRRF